MGDASSASSNLDSASLIAFYNQQLARFAQLVHSLTMDIDCNGAAARSTITPSKLKTLHDPKQPARESLPPFKEPSRYRSIATNKPIRRLSDITSANTKRTNKSASTGSNKLQTTAAENHGIVTGIQHTLQRVCHQLVRQKNTSPEPGESRSLSAASNKTPESNRSNTKMIKSDLKMPAAFASSASIARAPVSSRLVLSEEVAAFLGSAGDDDDISAGPADRHSNKKKFAAVLPASPTATPSKKSPTAKKMGTAEDYHSVLLNNRSVIVPIIPDRLYLGRLHDVPMPRVSDIAVFFSTDDEFMYENFFDDFGPLNLGNVYRYCKKIEKKVRLSGSRGRKLVHVGEASDNRLFANSAWLMGAYCIIVDKMSPDTVFERVSSLLNQTDMKAFPAFRDAATGVSTYDLSLLDCYRALEKAIRYGFFSYDTFNITEYEHYEKVENGDFNWISPKFLAFCGPSATSRLDNGYPLHAPEVYFSYFRKHNVTTIVRLNAPAYPAKRFTDAGFEHHDLIYPDGTSPPMVILNRFLRLCENARGAVAVHCKAGLGRTGTLIGAYLMKHFRLTTAETIAWLRIARPGSVIGQQQHFLANVKETLWKQGEACRTQLAITSVGGTSAATTADVGASGDAGLSKSLLSGSSSGAAVNQMLTGETGMHTPPGKTNEDGVVAALSTPPNAGKVSPCLAGEIVTDASIGTPGKEARIRRQNSSAQAASVAANATGGYDELEITDASGVGSQLKGRQPIRRDSAQQVAVGAAGKKSITSAAYDTDDAVAMGNGKTVGRRMTSVTEGNSNKKTTNEFESHHNMTTRRGSSTKSSPTSAGAPGVALPSGTVSNKRKRIFAHTAADDKTFTEKSDAGRKPTVAEQIAVTEEDIEGLISHAETVDELAALNKRHSGGRNKQLTPTKAAYDEAVQPTEKGSDKVDPSKEEARNEHLMDLFRENKLDKVATVNDADVSESVEPSTSAGDATKIDVLVASANCHLVSDTQHLTQGDMLNMAKAKRSVYPFGFGRGAGHGSSAARGKQQRSAVVVDDDDVDEGDDAGQKSSLRSAVREDKQSAAATASTTPKRQQRVVTVSPQPPASGNSAQLGRTRRQSRALTGAGDGSGSSSGNMAKLTPQRNLRGQTPPMPTADAGDAASSSASRPMRNKAAASPSPAVKKCSSTTPPKSGSSPKASNKSTRSEAAQKTSSPTSSSAYPLRSKPTRGSNM